MQTGEWVSEDQFKNLFINDVPLMDVRANVEFVENHFPSSVNLPILDNEQRAQVGTAYKQQGRESAMALGYQLVSGSDQQQKLQVWESFLKKNPSAVITCFRGGLRSKITQSWLQEMKNISRPRVLGGTKALRQYLLQNLEQMTSDTKPLPWQLVTGPTGSGKTLLLQSLQSLQSKVHVLDLEKMANHRGSAFGFYPTPQPAQAVFENQISVNLLKWTLHEKPIAIEDESRLIGRCVLPDKLFAALRKQPVILIQESLEFRIKNTYEEYVLQSLMQNRSVQAIYSDFQLALKKIEQRLGNQRYQEIAKDLLLAQQKMQDYELSQSGHLLAGCTLAGHSLAEHSLMGTSGFLVNEGYEVNSVWIQKLLTSYYDPMYTYSLKKRNPEVRFQGTWAECQQFMSNK